jgi:hypothetical protein
MMSKNLEFFFGNNYDVCLFLNVTRWEYTVKTGDVVFMYGDCQDRLQHCIKVEREDKGALEMGPRMSLVFKQRVIQ